MTINNMPLLHGQIVAECACDNCGFVFNIDWYYKDNSVYCPECNMEVRP
ncbi:hypothetical protein [Methanolobus halotolerans]|nr:hypothetical protein [Methanolobus halotolerans]